MLFRSLFAYNRKETQETDIILTLTPRIIRVLNLTAEDLQPFRVGRDSSSTSGVEIAPPLPLPLPQPPPSPSPRRPVRLPRPRLRLLPSQRQHRPNRTRSGRGRRGTMGVTRDGGPPGTAISKPRW